MRFNFFKHKDKEEPRNFEGRFITDEEIEEMTKPKTGTFIGKELKEIQDMMDELKKQVD